MNEKRRQRAELFKQRQADRISRFYDKRAWRDRVAPQQLRREPLCRICSRAGMCVAATEVDHIVPLVQGGDPFDWLNLQSVCHEHHSQKTRSEQLDQETEHHIKGATASGMPLDPNHPWNK